MAVDAFSLLTLFSVTILLGYISSLFFEKTRTPDTLWLMILGLLIGPVFNIVDKSIFISVIPLLSALALIVILFEAGLDLNFFKTLKSAPRAILLSFVNLVFAISGIALFGYLVMNLTITESILLGAIVSGTSSVVILSIVNKLRLRDKVKSMINIESIITDPFVIVIAIAIIQTITLNLSTSIGSTTNTIMSAFSIGAIMGLISGVIWIGILDRLRGKPLDYMLTIAVLFLMYVFVEVAGGSGAIAVLFFGIILGNTADISQIFRMQRTLKLDSVLRKFHTEVTFFIRSFFFVFMGIIVTISQEFILYGLAITGIIIITRIVGSDLSVLGMGFSKLERNAVRIMGARGLSAAVMAQLPIVYGIANASLYSDIAFIVIISSIIYTSLGVRLIYK